VLSTVWTPQRCSQSYTEKRRGSKETEVAWRRKVGIKRIGDLVEKKGDSKGGEGNQASDLTPK